MTFVGSVDLRARCFHIFGALASLRALSSEPYRADKTSIEIAKPNQSSCDAWIVNGGLEDKPLSVLDSD